MTTTIINTPVVVPVPVAGTQSPCWPLLHRFLKQNWKDTAGKVIFAVCELLTVILIMFLTFLRTHSSQSTKFLWTRNSDDGKLLIIFHVIVVFGKQGPLQTKFPKRCVVCSVHLLRNAEALTTTDDHSLPFVTHSEYKESSAVTTDDDETETEPKPMTKGSRLLLRDSFVNWKGKIALEVPCCFKTTW